MLVTKTNGADRSCPFLEEWTYLGGLGPGETPLAVINNPHLIDKSFIGSVHMMSSGLWLEHLHMLEEEGSL